MKKNYTLKTIRISFVALVFSLVTTSISAQTSTEHTFNLRSLADTNYPVGAIVLTSTEIALEGTTFKIQATVIPSGSGTFIGSSLNQRWGLGNDDTDNAVTTFDGNHDESATIDNIEIIDFDGGTSGYTVSAISDLHFNAIAIRSANGGNDNPRISVDGTGGGIFDLGQLAAATVTIVFGESFNNAASTTFTVGASDDVTSITLSNATEIFSNSYQIIGTSVSYTFTTDGSLSTESFEKDTLSVFPTIIENTFTVNKAFKTLHLFDISGRTSKIFNSSDVLEVTGLKSGMYIIKIESNTGGIETGRLIVK